MHLGDLDIDVRIILIRILKKYGVERVDQIQLNQDRLQRRTVLVTVRKLGVP
jgi:hypothetical protein